MNDFNMAVQTAMKTMTEDGSIEKLIEEKLRETVGSIVHEQLRSYSDFGKALQEKIDKELSIDLKNVTFTEYNKVVLNLIEGQVNHAVTGEALEKLKSDINKLFAPPPKEIKLSEVVDKFKEESMEWGHDDAEQIALIIEPREYGFVGIGLHPNNTKGYRHETITSWQDCDFYMSISISEEDENKGKLSRVYDRSGLGRDQFMPTCLSGITRLLYQMYCTGSVLIFDKGFDSFDYETHYHPEW